MIMELENQSEQRCFELVACYLSEPVVMYMFTSGVTIHSADVNAVIDLHSEQESLKVEDFGHCLGFLCAHVAEFRGKCSSFGNLYDEKSSSSIQNIYSRRGKSCEEEHKTFKAHFSKILGSHFSAVSNVDDFFYYRSSSNDQGVALVNSTFDVGDRISRQVSFGVGRALEGTTNSSENRGSTSTASDETLTAECYCIEARPYDHNKEAPLFVKFECTVNVFEEEIVTFPVGYIPSCMLNILDNYVKIRKSSTFDDLFEVAFYVTAVTWPRVESVFDSSTYPWLRGNGSTNLKPKKRCNLEESGLSSLIDDEPEPPGVLDSLSFAEKEVLDTLQLKIFRLVEFETVLAMSRYGNTEREDLAKIVKFISEQLKIGEDTSHFKSMKLDLLFVSNHERAFWRLRKRMESLCLDYCCLSQAQDLALSSTTFPVYYYCCSVKDKDLFQERYLTLLNDTGPTLCEEFDDVSSSSSSGKGYQYVSRREVLPGKVKQAEQCLESQSYNVAGLSRVNSGTAFISSPGSLAEKKVSCESFLTVGSQDSVTDLSKCELYDFWLILALDPFTAKMYFCQRYKLLHESLFKLLCDSLKSEWRIINQKTLLEQMFRSRTCDALLVPKDEDILRMGCSGQDTVIEAKSFSPSLTSTWSKKVFEIYSEGGTLSLPVVKCKAGQFTCEIVKHHWFFVHPRLRKTDVGVDLLRFALEVMKLELEEWKVKNRSNMYVLKDGEDWFYLRLHTDAATVYEGSVEPDNSWMTKMHKEFETNILLTVHGYCQSKTVVDVLIEKIHFSLARETSKALKEAIQIGRTLELYSEDIEYFQSNASTPERVFYFTLPKVVGKFLGTIFYYLRQQLGMYAVPVLDSAGFISYATADGEEPIFYVFNHKTGLGCIQLRLVLSDGISKATLEYARFGKDAFSQLGPVWNMSQIGLKAFLARLTHSRCLTALSVQGTTSDKQVGKDDFSSLVQFILWVPGGTEQDLVPIQSMCRLVVNQALCDLITEFGLLGKPILEFPAPASPAPQSVRSREDRRSGDTSIRHFSGDNRWPLPTTANNSFSTVRSSGSAARIPSGGSRSQSSQPDSSEKQSFLNAPVRRSSQNSVVDESSLEDLPCKQDVVPTVYVTAKFNAIAADWFDHILAELKSKKEDQYSLKKHSFRMDSDFAARKILQVVEKRFAAALPTETVTVFVVDPRGTKRLASVENTEQLFRRVDLDVGRVYSNDRKITAGGQQEPRNTKMALMASNLELDDAVLDYGADVSKNEAMAKNILSRELGNEVVRFQHSLDPFIPRRRLLYMTFSGDECELYMYNYSPKKADEIYKIFATAAFWLNGRSYLIREIGLDKMGITHLHQNFELVMDPSLMCERKAIASRNPCGDSDELVYEKALLWLNAKALTKYSFPDEEDPSFKETFCAGCDSPLEAQMRMKLYTYFQCPNSSLLLLKFYQEQCRQMVELESNVDILLKTHHLFEKLYDAVRCGCPEIVESDFLELIERSREVHFERAPMLFYPKWKSCIAPIRLGTRGSIEIPSPPRSADFVLTQQHSFLSHLSPLSTSKPPTPTNTKPTQPLHFSQSANSKRHSSGFESTLTHIRQNPDPFTVKLEFTFIEITRKSPNVWLFKAVDDGIIFVNLTFVKPHFSVRLFVWNVSQQGHSVLGRSYCEISSTRQKNLEFEKDLVIHLLHVQSYTYDFHLRMVAKYLVGGKQVLFDPGYDTDSLLKNLLHYFKTRPSRSRDGIVEGHLKISGLSVDQNVVWNDLLAENSKDRRVVALRTGSDAPIRYMLVWESFKKIFGMQYKIVCLCLQEGSEKPSNCLTLRCYTIVVCESKNYPFGELRRHWSMERFRRSMRIHALVKKIFYRTHHNRSGSRIQFMGSKMNGSQIKALECDNVFALRKEKSCYNVKRASSGIRPVACRQRNFSLKPSLYRQRMPVEEVCTNAVESIAVAKNRRVKSFVVSANRFRKSFTFSRFSSRKRFMVLKRKRFFDSSCRSLYTPRNSPTSSGADASGSFPTSQYNSQLLNSGLSSINKPKSSGEKMVVTEICPRQLILQKHLKISFDLFKQVLASLVEEASWQCRRDKLWLGLFSPVPVPSGGFPEKLLSGKKGGRPLSELRQVYSSAVTTDEVDELLTCTSVINLADIDMNFKLLSRDFLPEPFFRGIIRNFGIEKCRLVCSETKKYLAIAVERQSAFLFRGVGKDPIQMHLVFKEAKDSSLVVRDGQLVNAGLKIQTNELLNIIASFSWMELTATPVIGKIR